MVQLRSWEGWFNLAKQKDFYFHSIKINWGALEPCLECFCTLFINLFSVFIGVHIFKHFCVHLSTKSLYLVPRKVKLNQEKYKGTPKGYQDPSFFEKLVTIIIDDPKILIPPNKIGQRCPQSSQKTTTLNQTPLAALSSIHRLAITLKQVVLILSFPLSRYICQMI